MSLLSTSQLIPSSLNLPEAYPSPYGFSLRRSLHHKTIMNSPHLILLLFTVQLLTDLTPSLSSSSQAYPSPYGEESCDGPADPLVPPRREVYGNGRIFDITHRFREDMPAFGLPDGMGQFRWLVDSIKNGSLANMSLLKLIVHSGTHVDAPGHFYDNYYDAGFDIDSLDLDVLNGPALVVDVPRDTNITAEVMESLKIPKGVRRVIFRTLNTDRGLMWKSYFDSSFVGFTKDGAEWLVANSDIKLVGTDYFSVAAFDHLAAAHYAFLGGRDIILVEGLKLDNINLGLYSVHCLPLRLPGSDGSPIRCILIK